MRLMAWFNTAYSLYLLYLMGTYLYALWFMTCPPNPPGKLRRQWFIADYDFWVGCYLNRTSKEAYWMPVPFIGVKFWRDKK